MSIQIPFWCLSSKRNRNGIFSAPFARLYAQRARSTAKVLMFHALLRRGANPSFRLGTGTSDRSTDSASSRSSTSTRIPGRSERGPGFKPKLRIYTPTKAASTNQTLFCMPDCPVEDDLHSTGAYRHKGGLSHSLSFLFGAQNPPPEIWHAHNRLMMGEASEEEEELVLSFLAHHPFQAGNITDRIYFGEQGQLIMTGNPLSFTASEVPPMEFEPVKVQPVTSHPLLSRLQ
ncbi:MAG: hypothetical protein L6R35_006854 [Caloplaca aegaea]|nr:MAG: hypothetical protein L6R35_006854 [Caloplaca aegaea]